MWQIGSVNTESGHLLLAFDADGVKWAEEAAAAAGRSLEGLSKSFGAKVLVKKANKLQETRTPAEIADSKEQGLIELSSNVRIAFSEEAMRLFPEEDDDDYY